MNIPHATPACNMHIETSDSGLFSYRNQYFRKFYGPRTRNSTEMGPKGIVDSRYGRLRVADNRLFSATQNPFHFIEFHKRAPYQKMRKKLYGIALKSPLLKIIMVSDSVV